MIFLFSYNKNFVEMPFFKKNTSSFKTSVTEATVTRDGKSGTDSQEVRSSKNLRKPSGETKKAAALSLNSKFSPKDFIEVLLPKFAGRCAKLGVKINSKFLKGPVIRAAIEIIQNTRKLRNHTFGRNVNVEITGLSFNINGDVRAHLKIYNKDVMAPNDKHALRLVGKWIDSQLANWVRKPSKKSLKVAKREGNFYTVFSLIMLALAIVFASIYNQG